jgi:cell division protein ZapA (FtsZ GTPase activity inhibitor)
MAWYHRLTFAGMAAAVKALKHRSDEKHELARLALNPEERKRLRAKADELNQYASEMNEAYRERQEGRPNNE